MIFIPALQHSGMTSSPTGASPKKPRSAEGLATELVIAHVRGLILRSEMRAGEQLQPERELARRIGVSGPSVRGGLLSLAAKGEQVTRQGAGRFDSDVQPGYDTEPHSFTSVTHASKI